ncbi:MAG: T9SS type A sorting domain-containing protein [Vicingaceae bacterium]
MKKLLIAVIALPLMSLAQQAKDYSVLLTATVTTNPPSIVLKWPQSTSQSYTVYRKLKSSNSFGSALANLSASDSIFIDTAVSVGESYEYRLRKQGSNYWGYGYIHAGIEAPPQEIKGKLILLVDSAVAMPLSAELDRFVNDLDGEGWAVLRHEVPSSSKVADVKSLILSDYALDQTNTKAVVIVGHVAVPYSGNLAPDGHNNHVGAWPADLYYGELNGSWTDNFVNNTTASDSRNHNIPGDGKFDNTSFPSSVELQVGRIDLSDMPAFSLSEIDLLKRYFDKNHAYRTKKFEAVQRAVIDDNFGGFSGEAFAASAWKSFAPMVGPDSIIAGDYFTLTRDKSYIWSYGCGGGSFTSAGGIGNTNNFAADSLQSIFTALFGSYFGDWDRQNNFLRAPLAQGLTLTNAWSGRPHWHFHHMGLGENIGYSMLLASNNGPYESNYASGFVHIGFMGDPTLKLHIIFPPSNLQAVEASNKVDLTWTASAENVLGYHIYRKKSFTDLYERVNSEIITGTSYTDDPDQVGEYFYSVRAIKLQEGFSGSYYNLSTGSGTSITTEYTGLEKNLRSLEIDVFPNPNQGSFTLELNTSRASRLDVTLMSIDGRIVESRKTNIEAGKTTLFYEHEDLKSGLYLLRISTELVIETRKVIVR